LEPLRIVFSTLKHRVVTMVMVVVVVVAVVVLVVMVYRGVTVRPASRGERAGRGEG
jgi:hypothetical protein